MTKDDLASILSEEIEKRGWTVSKLAEEAGLPFETARRAVRGIGNPGLRVTTSLLVAVQRELSFTQTREAAS